MVLNDFFWGSTKQAQNSADTFGLEPVHEVDWSVSAAPILARENSKASETQTPSTNTNPFLERSSESMGGKEHFVARNVPAPTRLDRLVQNVCLTGLEHLA